MTCDIDPLRDAPTSNGCDEWNTGGLRVPWTPACMGWWAALRMRVAKALAEVPGGCLVFDSPRQIRDLLQCEGLDLLQLAKQGWLAIAHNRHFLRVLPGPIRALPENE